MFKSISMKEWIASKRLSLTLLYYILFLKYLGKCHYFPFREWDNGNINKMNG